VGRVAKIDETFLWQQVSDGVCHGETADAAVENSDGM
jgi:hypothetical protein